MYVHKQILTSYELQLYNMLLLFKVYKSHPTDNGIFLVTKSSQTTRLQAPDRNMVLCEYISRFLMITTYCEQIILMVVAYPLKMVDTQCQ